MTINQVGTEEFKRRFAYYREHVKEVDVVQILNYKDGAGKYVSDKHYEQLEVANSILNSLLKNGLVTEADLFSAELKTGATIPHDWPTRTPSGAAGFGGKRYRGRRRAP